jgi:anti-sigma factor RsiW
MKEGGEISLDAILVAYLDGELEPEAHEKLERLLKSDPSVRERLAMLLRGGRPFKRTFDAVLDLAPRKRLQALIASVNKFARPNWLARSRRWTMAIAAALLLAIGAGTVGYLLGQSSPNLFDIGNSEEAWIDAVANQVLLYSREFVASIPVDETTQKTELGRLSGILKVDLSQARVALPGLTLKRVELLQFENRPLAQLLYEGEHGVVVFCIMSEPGGESERESERRANLNTVYWASGNYRFVLIGPAPAETMEKLADMVQGRFAS